MLRFIYTILLVTMIPVWAVAQGECVSASIEQGSRTNSLSLQIRSTVAFDASKCDNIVFTIRTPISAGPALTFTEYAHAPAFNHLSFTIRKLTVTDGGYQYFIVSGTGNMQANAGQAIAPDMPFQVLELSYHGAFPDQISLVNLENDIPGNIHIRPQFYFQTNLGDITRHSGLFYGSGSTIAVNNEPATGNDWATIHPVDEQPLQFLSFQVKEHELEAVINWQVLYESALTEDYVIERSIQGRPFIAIASIQANRNAITQNYRYTDEEAGLIAGNAPVAYRIRQKDHDGRPIYSAIETAQFSSDLQDIAIYPNPALTSTTLSFLSTEPGQAMIKLMSFEGKTLRTFRQHVKRGRNFSDMNLRDLPAGQYSIILTVNGKRKTSFVIKQAF